MENKEPKMIVKTNVVRVIGENNPLRLSSGKYLAPIDIAYETYGTLNQDGSNAIFICHALSGDAHAAGYNSLDDKKPGWWDNMVGPGKGIDTNKYFVICSNFLGGCSGTTGPGSINPATQKPYNLDFPLITIADMVKVQKLLIDKLGVNKLLAVIGGSMGGMQVMQWAVDFPDFVQAIIPIATTTKLGAQSIAFDAVGRNAITADPDFQKGNYSQDNPPAKGLGIARMIGHITYLSEKGMHEKFGRQLRNADSYSYDFNSEFSIETYLEYQGQSFVERFDANSYLYITKAMDYFDLEEKYGSLSQAFNKTDARFLVLGFSSDWLFTPAQSMAIVNALEASGKFVSYCNIQSPYGHDSFLLEPQKLGKFLSSFLDSIYEPRIIKNETKTNLKKKDIYSFLRARVDYEQIESLIECNSSVLDVGCGDGTLLVNLTRDKNISGRGIELDEQMILECIGKGLAVIQHDIEKRLSNFADDSFDYVILSQTLQTVANPEKVLKELLRIGKKVIVSFPNFAHWRCRLQLALCGKAPVSEKLPYGWHDSPNIHFLSMKDFENFCADLNIKIEKKIPITKNRLSPVKLIPNLFAEEAIYLTSK